MPLLLFQHKVIKKKKKKTKMFCVVDDNITNCEEGKRDTRSPLARQVDRNLGQHRTCERGEVSVCSAAEARHRVIEQGKGGPRGKH